MKWIIFTHGSGPSVGWWIQGTPECMILYHTRQCLQENQLSSGPGIMEARKPTLEHRELTNPQVNVKAEFSIMWFSDKD